MKIPMILLLVAVIIVAAIVVANTLGVIGKAAQDKTDEVWPYYALRVMSTPEQVLYFRLVAALPELIVMPQVQLTRVLGVKKGHSYQTWGNRINRMSLDFVVTRKDSSVVAAVELDDASHRRRDRVEADAKKDKALESAGVRIVRWNVKAIPSAEEIRDQLGVDVKSETLATTPAVEAV